jgi:hypothetical protein
MLEYIFSNLHKLNKIYVHVLSISHNVSATPYFIRNITKKKEELCNVHLSELLLCFCTLPATITGL